MSDPLELVTITKDTITQYPGLCCFMNPQQEGARTRLDWIRERFAGGLTIRLLYDKKTKKTAGYIEYIPGENAWRAVDAAGYLFIHCIWVYPKARKDQGNGTRLVQACIADAKENGYAGVAVVASEGPFLAGRKLFEKNGFSLVSEEKPSFSLLASPLRDDHLPRFRDWRSRLAGYHGLHVIYANQCPWVSRSIGELTRTARESGIDITVTELKTAKEAQNAPSVYGIFSLVYNGRLLADHYISTTRFKNILKKEIQG